MGGAAGATVGIAIVSIFAIVMLTVFFGFLPLEIIVGVVGGSIFLGGVIYVLHRTRATWTPWGPALVVWWRDVRTRGRERRVREREEREERRIRERERRRAALGPIAVEEMGVPERVHLRGW
ncbi:uncharacterized protein LY89DRAFT_735294 [Mollisia scopiformis]|uniref:Uncharacterized protein n=1 Tax=Mollisia scopiformis TaxID=149040 RepID=A0A194X4Q8_MOLSC|nr:uncharacterized protein LY89DRAFT_735294 [Mollisia scopiformis]KUJ15161.1 hypothetical protein LY89DRAFT_735294 [Mollisia scopiformis]